MRADDIFGASGRQTVTNTDGRKEHRGKKEGQEEAERTAEIAPRARDQRGHAEPPHPRGQRPGKKKRPSRRSSPRARPRTRDLRCANRPSRGARQKEQTEQAAEIGKPKVIEAAQVDKERTIEAALVDKQITLTLQGEGERRGRRPKASAPWPFARRADQEASPWRGWQRPSV